MARSWFIFGETLVKVNGSTGGFLDQALQTLTNTWELGLSVDPIRVTPRFVQQGIHCDDFGPDIPADIIQYLADATIHMRLVHYDPVVLARCVSESLATLVVNQNIPNDGTLGPAGQPLGAGVQWGTPGNRYIQLNLYGAQPSPGSVLGNFLQFPTAILAEQPIEYPLGTEKSIVALTWKAIPYAPILIGKNQKVVEPTSSGNEIWTYPNPGDPGEL